MFPEAGQPNGATYRLASGCVVPLSLVSMVYALARLF
jgi:hypothetical protein